jgi:hypothetical protein
LNCCFLSHQIFPVAKVEKAAPHGNVYKCEHSSASCCRGEPPAA